MAAALLLWLSGFSRSAQHANENLRSCININIGRSLRKYSYFIAVFTAIVIMRSAFLFGVQTFLPTYIQDVLASKILMGIVLSMGYIGPIFGQLLFGYLTEKKGGRYAVVLSGILTTIFFFMLLVVHKPLILVVAEFAGLAFSAFNAFAIVLGYMGQVIPKKALTSANAVVWNIGDNAGGAAGIALFSVLLLYVSLPEAMWLFLGISIIAILMLPLLFSKKRMPMGSA